MQSYLNTNYSGTKRATTAAVVVVAAIFVFEPSSLRLAVVVAAGFFLLCRAFIFGVQVAVESPGAFVSRPDANAGATLDSGKSRRRTIARRAGAFTGWVTGGGSLQRTTSAAIALTILLLPTKDLRGGEAVTKAEPKPSPKRAETSLLTFADGRLVFELRSGFGSRCAITIATSTAQSMMTTTTPGC